MHFYIDHDVNAGVARELARYGHTARTTRDWGRTTAEDPEHLLEATRAQAVLVSHNWKDFRLLHIAWQYWSQQWGVPQPHGGILILPHGTVSVSLGRLLAFVRRGEPTVDRLYRCRDSTGWREAGP